MKKTKLMIKRRNQKVSDTLMRILVYTIPFALMTILVVRNNELTQQLQEKENIISEKEIEIYQLNLNINALHNVIADLDEQLEHVSKVNESYVDELNTFREREELYDKYEYALVSNEKRTELTYEEVKYGEELMLANNLNPHLMFGSIMVESNANRTAVNTRSGAAGYGQFLDSTARWLWVDVLGNETYDSNIRKDGKTNILMMATYYNYLYPVTNWNTFKVIKRYSGNTTNEGTASYIRKINNYTSTVGVKIE